MDPKDSGNAGRTGGQAARQSVQDDDDESVLYHAGDWYVVIHNVHW